MLFILVVGSILFVDIGWVNCFVCFLCGSRFVFVVLCFYIVRVVEMFDFFGDVFKCYFV